MIVQIKVILEIKVSERKKEGKKERNKRKERKERRKERKNILLLWCLLNLLLSSINLTVFV